MIMIIDNLPELQMINESYTSQRKGKHSFLILYQDSRLAKSNTADLHMRIIERLQELHELEAWYGTRYGEFHAKVEEAYLRQSGELVQQRSTLERDKQRYERDRELVLGELFSPPKEHRERIITRILSGVYIRGEATSKRKGQTQRGWTNIRDIDYHSDKGS